MLNDNQKKLIEAEERFRYEERHKLISSAAIIDDRLTSVKEEIESDGKKVISKISNNLALALA